MKELKIIVNMALLAVLVWFLSAHQQKIRATVASRDSIQYWAAGKLLVHRQNPYSVNAMMDLERSAGDTDSRPLMLRTPPWSVWMVLPFGLLNAFWGWVTWLALLFSSLMISSRITWRMYGDGAQPPAVFLIVAYLFAPVVACLVAGQVGLFMLLGISLFLFLEEKRPFLAGMALIIPMIKPHIFVLMWPILGLWILLRRRWALLQGFAVAFAIAMVIAFAFDPEIFQHYREMLRQQAIQNEFIPALSGMLRALPFFRKYFFVQFVPMSLGMAWSLAYYWKNRGQWSWQRHGLAVLVVAVLTTPYAWMTDEAVLLPAVLQGVLWLHKANLKIRSQLMILLFVGLNLLLLLIVRAQVPPATGIFFWSSLVWFGWYWYARSFAAKRSTVAVELIVA